MSSRLGKCSRIRHIVRLRQMLRRWRVKASAAARMAAAAGSIPSDVPAGHVALCVGAASRRFVVRATYLNHPVFQTLLSEAEEEFGFAAAGPLAIPCDESLFEEILRFVARTEPGSARFATLDDFQRCGHAATETRPLLRAEKSV